jgi:hypothetical protein
MLGIAFPIVQPRSILPKTQRAERTVLLDPRASRSVANALSTEARRNE